MTRSSRLSDHAKSCRSASDGRRALVRDDMTIIAEHKKSDKSIVLLLLGMPRAGGVLPSCGSILFLPLRAPRAALHRNADRVSAARLLPLLPADPRHHTHHRAHIHHQLDRSRLALARRPAGGLVRDDGGCAAGCCTNRHGKPRVARRRMLWEWFACATPCARARTCLVRPCESRSREAMAREPARHVLR